jgi:hypothetical protein
MISMFGVERCHLILAGVVFASLTLAAQSTAADLRGLYVVTKVPPPSKALSDAVSAAFSVPGVSGAVLVFGWDVIEPAMGQYDFSDFDQWMTMAASAGKKVELSITTGYVGSNHTPSWLFQPSPGGGGANALIFSFTRKPTDTTCLTESIAAPWDPAFLAQWDAMLAAVSAHLKSTGRYDTVVLLRLTGINKDSDELHLPSEPADPTVPCRSDNIATWQQAGYRPSLLLQGWDGTTGSFKKSFPDKSFSVAIIASADPFPPIAEDGSIIKGAIPQPSLPLLTLAAQKFPGHLVIQNNSLYPDSPAQPETIQSAQSLGTMIAFQTNEDVTAQGAGCGSRGDPLPTPCTAGAFLAMLNTGIYPLGTGNALRAQYIEVFALNVNAFPGVTLTAYDELLGIPPRHRAARH